MSSSCGFLTNVPGGKNLFESNKDKIKSKLDAAGVASFFEDCVEKLQKSSSGSEALASETFAFPVEQEEQWALELQKDVNEFRSRLDVPGAAMSYNFDSSIKQDISIKQEFSDNAPCHCMSTPYPAHTLSVSRSPLS